VPRNASLSRDRKVPEPSTGFWFTKLATTAFGEAVSDTLVLHFNPVVVVLVTFVVFALALGAQLVTKNYRPWLYWTAVTMVAVFGTMAADVIHIVIGVPYWLSSAAFAVVLAAVLLLWKRTEHTLDVHSITTIPRELFYWATVMATFALGTAAGDLFATQFHLGYLGAAIVFFLIILIPLTGFTFLHWNAVGSFWFAYIVTRPLGASVADWLDNSRRVGGIGFGHVATSLALFFAVIVFMIAAQRADKATRGTGGAETA
jgi:uncharacterized membrane-anchored protein